MGCTRADSGGEACCGASSLEPAPFLGGTFLQLKAEAAGSREQHGAHSRLCRRDPPPAVAATVLYRQPCKPPSGTRPGHLAAEREVEHRAAWGRGRSAPPMVMAVLRRRSSSAEGMAGVKALHPACAHAWRVCAATRLLGTGGCLAAELHRVPCQPPFKAPHARGLVREPPKQRQSRRTRMHVGADLMRGL